MTDPKKKLSLKALSPAIHGMLSGLRSKIRSYVFLEGIAWMIAWAIISFWVSLAFDYLPVLSGFNELSRPARIVLLVLAGILLGWILFQFVLRRVFVPMKDSSMALLVEKNYPIFNDSLLTTVGRTLPSADQDESDPEMLERTRVEAETLVPSVQFSNVLNARPLRRALTIAILLSLSIVGFAIAKPAAMKLAAQRLYLLDDQTWPRLCQIEMVGIKVKRENPVEGIEELGQMIQPINGEFRIAKGATLTLMVRAESDDDNARKLPNTCTLQYRTDEGNSGSQVFKKIGAPRDGFQLYSLDGQPLSGVLTDLTFHVRGGDHRLGPFTIKVVDEPSVFETKLACQFPDYIVDESSLRWTDRTIDWSGQARLPEGTKIIVLAKSNKPLAKVYAIDSSGDPITVIKPKNNEFEYSFDELAEQASVQFYLADVDGIVSELPHTVLIESIEDQPPMVQTRLSGIGTAVTPDVMIPFSGQVDDDYGMARTWIEIEVAETEVLEENVLPDIEGALETTIDFKQRRQDKGDSYELPTEDDSTVALVVKSIDKYDLKESPNMGIGDRYVLDVVTPNELIRILERSEVGQRRRLEQIYLELVDARNYLVRSKSRREIKDREIIEPGDKSSVEEPGDSDESEDELRKQELRLLFSQRAILQIDKSRQEILGCAEAFDNIRLQLINNRIDSEDRKKRFSEEIITPLRLIGDVSMQQLRERIVDLESGLRNLQLSPEDEQVSDDCDDLAFSAMEQADEVLKQLDEVLNVLIKFETQNELLEIVRKMIQEQQEILERTKKERQRKAFEGLLDLE